MWQRKRGTTSVKGVKRKQEEIVGPEVGVTGEQVVMAVGWAGGRLRRGLAGMSGRKLSSHYQA